MYIFEINLKNSPSASCHNKDGGGGGGGGLCVCLFRGVGSEAGKQ